MNGLAGLKTINYVSLILALLTFLYSTNIISWVKWGLIGAIALGACVLFFLRELNRSNYSIFTEGLKKGFAVMGILVLLSFYKPDYMRQINGLAPYLLIYLISGITVLRLQRQKEYAGENKLIGSLNYLYSFLLILGAFLFGEEGSRAFLLKLLARIWNLLPDELITVLSYIGFALVYFLSLPFLWLIHLLKGKTLVLDNMKKGLRKPRFNFEDPYEDQLSALLHKDWFQIFIGALVFALVVYLGIRIFQKSIRQKNQQEGFEEEKEFLRNEASGSGKLVKKVLSYMKPKSPNQLIRYYYSKILKLCKKKQIEIGIGDTSLDVNRKSGFSAKKMEELRETYIKVRYSDYQADKEDLKAFVKNYKGIADE